MKTLVILASFVSVTAFAGKTDLEPAQQSTPYLHVAKTTVSGNSDKDLTVECGPGSVVVESSSVSLTERKSKQ
jgi:hypothetical protein